VPVNPFYERKRVKNIADDKKILNFLLEEGSKRMNNKKGVKTEKKIENYVAGKNDNNNKNNFSSASI
jgi:hypothetical protein